MPQPFNIAHIEPSSFIYGPGERFVIWVQGCTLGCQGCWNRTMLSKRPKQLIAREALLQKILDLDSIQGVSLLGGEPLQQLSNVLWLLQQVKSAALDTMVFTGYEWQEIINSEKAKILPFTDILISGRYVAVLRNINLQWRGSSNQQVHFPTGQYDASLIKEGNYVEVHFEADGRMRILGFPELRDGICEEKPSVVKTSGGYSYLPPVPPVAIHIQPLSGLASVGWVGV